MLGAGLPPSTCIAVLHAGAFSFVDDQGDQCPTWILKKALNAFTIPLGFV